MTMTMRVADIILLCNGVRIRGSLGAILVRGDETQRGGSDKNDTFCVSVLFYIRCDSVQQLGQDQKNFKKLDLLIIF